MYVLGQCKFKCSVYPAQLFCVSHSIVIFTVVIKNIKNIGAVSTNQIADILHYNDKNAYPPFLIDEVIKKYFDSKFSSNQNQLKGKPDVHYFKLPYIDNFSHHIKNKLSKLCKKFCQENFNIKLVFNSFKIKNYFSYKDPIRQKQPLKYGQDKSNSKKNGRFQSGGQRKKENNLPVQNKTNPTIANVVNITKNGQIVKTINVRRKSRYFNGKNRLIF